MKDPIWIDQLIIAHLKGHSLLYFAQVGFQIGVDFLEGAPLSGIDYQHPLNKVDQLRRISRNKRFQIMLDFLIIYIMIGPPIDLSATGDGSCNKHGDSCLEDISSCLIITRIGHIGS